MERSSNACLRIRCTAAASPATHEPGTVGSSGSARTASTNAVPGGSPGRLNTKSTAARPGSGSSASGVAISTSDARRSAGGDQLEELRNRGKRRLVPGQQQACRVAGDLVAPARARDRDPGPGSAAVAHAERRPPSWTTMSTSSSSARTVRGVSVRNGGREPSGIRNSFPFHAGTTSSPATGSRSRTLAAGSGTGNPASSGPAEGDPHQPRTHRVAPRRPRRGETAAVPAGSLRSASSWGAAYERGYPREG